MSFLSTALIAWVGLGALTLVLFILMEIAAAIRNPAYVLDMQRLLSDEISSEPPIWWKHLLVFLAMILFWPPIMSVVIRACRNKQSCVEQMWFDKQDNKVKENRIETKIRLMKEGAWPVNRFWTMAVKDENGQAHLHSARFLVSLDTGTKALHVKITHSVWERPDGKQFICYRVITDPVLNIPMFTTTDRAAAFAWCDNDWDWVVVCAPGKEEERIKIGLEQVARLETGGQK
jgi:hypothetical protein